MFTNFTRDNLNSIVRKTQRALRQMKERRYDTQCVCVCVYATTVISQF